MAKIAGFWSSEPLYLFRDHGGTRGGWVVTLLYLI